MWRPGELLADRFDDDVQHRNEDDVQESGHHHPAGHRRADRMPGFLSRTGGKDERKHAENKRQGRHQDRTQTNAGRLDGGIEDRQAALAELFGELHDQNGVLRSQPNQHDESDLAIHVVRQSADPLRRQCPQDRERNAEQYDEGQHETFILRREREVDQQQRKSEDQNRLAACLRFFEGDAGPRI